ncbi:MAG: homocysteine S-methyltransferase family protein [Reyranella sp.]|nr:homocysteine S-methyltransferase family protein [Reyranella sp.]
MKTTARYRHRLPQGDGGLFLTDGGIETSLIFQDGLDLPLFAAFPLMRDAKSRQFLIRYYERYIDIARTHAMGFVLESPTWRASADWGAKLGYSAADIAAINADAIGLMHDLRDGYEDRASPMVVSGCIGPRGDGYVPGEVMSEDAAESYHALQVEAFADAGADMVSATTMTNTSEAIGIVRAALQAGMPVAIAFTVETDGRLPTGQTLTEAISLVDQATANGPAYYMINCAHPTHFREVMEADQDWTRRIRGLRANASRRSHQELNDSPDLDAGDPIELGGQYRDLLQTHPQINVLGGCCGTDHRHVECIALACKTVSAAGTA